jgi:hypothetical protein
LRAFITHSGSGTSALAYLIRQRHSERVKRAWESPTKQRNEIATSLTALAMTP